ncbi:HutP protein [Keratinibaculum paraultunense]|uniref:Hut operon positive regulatory protein n=1 Tax=Keratinibaculum paraultunense TaxID=1278232 RepID=A0A4R3KRJ8_9FIRM|nr:HutP family protein [Keratinibaculum paraultunense]QQY79606.1 HutP family protein [Keratinibaculum paraultunense]TCS87630.1 HutP protein [Keratinibaculum paraultunense]
MNSSSIEVAKAAIKLAVSTREEERIIIDELKKEGIKSCAVDVGGDLINSIPTIIERALVASKKTGIIKDIHVHEGAVAGAAKDAISQLNSKALGLNFGGKLGIARSGEHIVVCLFISIGLLHLNDLAIAIGHRSIPIVE